MDKSKLIEIFTKHVNNYDLKQYNISMKYKHTLKTANLSYEIAKSLNLDEENCILAYAIGILHDYARFEQWTKFKTFNDLKSFDHGDYAAIKLFDENEIEKFEIDKKFYKTIRLAIENHNKWFIDYEKILNESKKFKNAQEKEKEFILHSKIIRDADKLDIFRIIKKISFSPNNIEYTNGGISQKILKRFKEFKSNDVKDVVSLIDRAIFLLTFTFDLNFAYSKNLTKEMGYSKAIYEHFKPHLNEENKKILEEAVEWFDENWK